MAYKASYAEFKVYCEVYADGRCYSVSIWSKKRVWTQEDFRAYCELNFPGRQDLWEKALTSNKIREQGLVARYSSRCISFTNVGLISKLIDSVEKVGSTAASSSIVNKE